MNIAIVGAGIGGLAAALALRQRGFTPTVYEQAPQLGEVGAGLGLMTNAVRVLQALGLGDTIRRETNPLEVAFLGTARGSVLKSFRVADFLSPGAPGSAAVHRADLHRWLREALTDTPIVTDHACAGFVEHADHVEVRFRDRPAVPADLLIGADGFNSVIRQQLHGATPVRYSGQTCYRGVAQYKMRDATRAGEINGRGRRASVIAIGPERVYWWAAINAPLGEHDVPTQRRERLLRDYAGWAFDVPEAIAATPSDAILRHDLIDRPPLKAWGKGRVTLLGDAAHPMVPNLGQGACSAIEDAYVLARHLANAATVAALRAYEAERLPRTTMLVNDSWNFGIPARWSGSLATWFRDTLLWSMPRWVMARAWRSYLDFDATRTPGK